MSWHTYLMVHFAAAIMWLMLPLSALHKRRLGILRIAAAAFALAFFVDSPFECDHVWVIEGGPHERLLSVPIENMFLIAASVPFAIVLYVVMESLVRKRTARL